MFMRFTWRGEPILDIRKWAKERGEKMVTYHAERLVPSPWCPWGLAKDEEDGCMPACFYDHMQIANGWTYTELSREDA